MSMDVVMPVVGALAAFVALLVVLKVMRAKGLSFTVRVFTALGLGILLGLAMQLLMGRDGEATTVALDWISIVGQGYIALLKMLVMPLVFVAILGAFTRAEVTEHFGRIAGVVLAVLLGTVTVAAVIGWGSVVLSGLTHASFLDGAAPDASELSALTSQQGQVADLTLPQELLSFIPTNPLADLAACVPRPPSRWSSSRPFWDGRTSSCAIRTASRPISSSVSSTACTASSCAWSPWCWGLRRTASSRSSRR